VTFTDQVAALTSLATSAALLLLLVMWLANKNLSKAWIVFAATHLVDSTVDPTFLSAAAGAGCFYIISSEIREIKKEGNR